MPTFYDSNGKPYALSIEIGRGGEGTVFYCPNDISLVAKIYHEPIDDEKAEKLRWMAANKNDQLFKVSAWIVDTLHDKNGKTVGFIMPNVRAKEIHELYSLKSRRVHFPDATWQFLLHTATNVARAFYVLHKNDHIMGDVNHGNCVVLADGTVKLIDCDSYSIKTDKIRYACEVGVATHLAPELQGIDLSEVEREKKHDNFGLAVIIFQLLFLGRHPFAGNYLGAEDKSLEDCIRERRFAYGNEDLTNVKQPPGTLSLSQVSVRVAMMFERAFMTKDRPEPREWIEALEDLSKNLKQCVAHIGHYYFQELHACPWCEIESKTGLIIFPFVSNEKGDSEKAFNIFTIESLLASLDIPKNLPAKPFKPKVLPPPSPEVVGLKKEKVMKFGGLAALYFFLLIFLVFIVEVQNPFFWGLISLSWFWSMNQKLNNDNKKRLESDLQEARDKWNKLNEEWAKDEGQNLINNDLTLIREKITEHQALHKERGEYFEDLKKEFLQNSLKAYLCAFRLEDIEIEKKYKDALQRFGLTTIADIEEKRLRSMLAIDDKTKNILLEHRKELEKGFVFNSNSELPELMRNRFEIEFNEKRRSVEKEIEQLLTTLRSGAMVIRQHQKQMVNKAENIAQRLLQAESDLVTLGGEKVMIGIFILISLSIPSIGVLFQTASTTRGFFETTQTPRPMPTTKPNVSYNPSKIEEMDNKRYPVEANYQVNENITDKELAEMSAVDREKAARTLHKQAQNLIEAEDYKNAEKKLRLAVKFVDYYVNILYTLGNLLYDQKKYSESIKFLEKSLIIDSANENAKLLIGLNFMGLNKNDEGERIFLEILEKNPDSFEANFNLGLIYKKTNSFAPAKERFEKAVEIKPDNVGAIYEYGICLYKIGDSAGAKKQYEKLLKLDPQKAKGLRPPLRID